MKKRIVCSPKISKSPDETFDIAKELASKINAPCLIGLTGELGTGKTVFAKGFAYGLGIRDLITSPTFLGMIEYPSPAFIHMDFFKKVVPKENIESYLNVKSIVLIEWIENFSYVFKETLDLDIRICIKYLKDGSGNILENVREIIIE